MKRFKSLLAASIVSAILIPAGSVAADTVSVTANQVVITATVNPQRYVELSSGGEIVQIISNTALPNVESKFYSGSTTTAHQVLPTANMLEQMDRLLSGKRLQPGILYTRTTIPKTEPKTSFILNLKKQLY